MCFRFVAAIIALCGLSTLLLATPAKAQNTPELPSQRHASLRTAADLPMQNLPRVNGDSLRADARDRQDRTVPYRYGHNLNTDFSPSRSGTWEQASTGEWIWRLRLRSDGAHSLSAGLKPFRLPPGAELYLHDTNNRQIRGPFTREDATRGQLWTPLVQSDVVILQLLVPEGRREAVDLVVETVVHGYRSVDRNRNGTLRKSGTCNLDVACDEADPWRNQVRSVGRYSYSNESSTFVCSGALVNNTANDGRPFFLTAEHCISNEDQAASMVFYWNFEVNTCRTQGTSENGTFPDDSLSIESWDQTSTGAILRARYGNTHSTGSIAGKPDLSLVEVDDSIPSSYDLFLSGWSRAGNTTDESVTIHHPAGHGKRISIDRDPSSLIGYSGSSCSSPSGDTHLLIEDWEVGTTEAGSSGSPLFSTSQLIVGVLSGGCAGCGGDGDADDNNAPDWYGRVAPGFENGDYVPPGESQPTTFADILDPVNSGMQTLTGRPLSQDTIPPAPVPNFTVANVTPDSVTLEWEATGDDGTEGVAQHYDVRVRTQRPITSESDFWNASRVENPPLPKASGTSQSLTISVNQDTSYYFAIRAVDDAGLASPISATNRDVTPVSELRVTTAPSPNPTRSQAITQFVVETEQRIRATLYDAMGRRVAVLLHETIRPFRKTEVRADVSTLSSGIYFLRIRGESTARTERVAVVK